MRRVAAIAVAALLVAGCTGGPTDDGARGASTTDASTTETTVPSPEAIELEHVPIAPEAGSPRNPAFTADGRRLVLSAAYGPDGRVELLSVGLDGSGLRCLSCDGTESATRDGGLLGRTRYLADITVTGDHHGYLRADATLGAAGMRGTITSEVDGNRLTLPRPSP